MNVTYKYHTNNASLYIMELDIIKLIFITGFSTTYPLGALFPIQPAVGFAGASTGRLAFSRRSRRCRSASARARARDLVISMDVWWMKNRQKDWI